MGRRRLFSARARGCWKQTDSCWGRNVRFRIGRESFWSSVGAKRIHDCLRAVAVGFVLIGITTAGLGFAPTLLVFLIIDFLTGLATPLAASPAFTMLQQESAEDMQGRVFGLLKAFSPFGTPLGMLVFGPLADMIDVRLIFIIGGALTIPLGCWLGHVGAVTWRADAGGGDEDR
nr:MFS transporter [Bifidobacterium sp. SO1]